jgi:hypothetical protein
LASFLQWYHRTRIELFLAQEETCLAYPALIEKRWAWSPATRSTVKVYLKREVEDWLNSNVNRWYFKRKFDIIRPKDERYFIDFNDRTDAMRFKLTWL